MTELSMPRRLYFLRHGQTEWNARRLFQGQTDIPLNTTGRGQAKACAGLVRSFFASRGTTPSLSMTAASPLARAAETARIVLEELGALPGAKVPRPADIVFMPGLMEQQYGLWEGLNIEEIRQRFPGSVERQFANMRTFMADGGESLASMRQRVLASVRQLPEEALIVGHFGTLFCIMLTIWSGDCSRFPAIPQDAFFVLEEGRILRVDKTAPEGRELLPE